MIVNRVAQSSLITFNLENLYQTGQRVNLDLSQWLEDGLTLKEKDFRKKLTNYQWHNYKNKFVALYCSTDSILPAWAFLLVTTYLQPFAKKIIRGTLEDLEVQLFFQEIQNLDLSSFKDKSIIIKGCSENIPEDAYIQLITKLQPIVKSLSYGEACSSVPLYKKKK